jgi:lysyl-tRNA synthetase class 2
MSLRLEQITQERLNKLASLRAQGIAPYPNRYGRSHTVREALSLFDEQGEEEQLDQSLSLAGRMTALRDMGKAAFADITDGSGRIQIYFRRNDLGEDRFALLRDFDIGDFIGVTGHLFKTRTGEVTLKISDFQMLSKAMHPLPEKWHGLTDVEKRYRQRYLDLIANPEVRELFVVRSRIISSIRRFLDGRGFIEVDTPMLQSSAGGAAAKPFTTHHNALDQDLYLRIATELHLKRLIVGGFDKVYEIGRIFRNEGISTKHNPEFTTLESYEAYADYQDVMKMTEELVSATASEALGTTKVQYGDAVVDLSPPWKRVSLREAIIEGCGIDFEEYPDTESLRDRMKDLDMQFDLSKGRGKLIDELISSFVEPQIVQPTFLVDYPVDLSPLAKQKPDNPRIVERFEAFAVGMEIANAFSELNDPFEQRERFRLQLEERKAGDEETELPDEDFLLALEHGMPPCGGLGIGIDRLVMLLTDQQSIREVIFFPQLKMKE